jgi:hypothetical protein
MPLTHRSWNESLAGPRGNLRDWPEKTVAWYLANAAWWQAILSKGMKRAGSVLAKKNRLNCRNRISFRRFGQALTSLLAIQLC